jgi:hypothetical protein
MRVHERLSVWRELARFGGTWKPGDFDEIR